MFITLITIIIIVMVIALISEERIRNDKRRFLLWANHHLQKRSLQVKELGDFADGVLLLNLLEEAFGRKIPRYIKTPKFLQHRIENVTIALNFVEKMLDIKVIGCNAKDIADGNLKQIMALFFMLVQKSKPDLATGDDKENAYLEKESSPEKPTVAIVAEVSPAKQPEPVKYVEPIRQAEPVKQPEVQKVEAVKEEEVKQEAKEERKESEEEEKVWKREIILDRKDKIVASRRENNIEIGKNQKIVEEKKVKVEILKVEKQKTIVVKKVEATEKQNKTETVNVEEKEGIQQPVVPQTIKPEQPIVVPQVIEPEPQEHEQTLVLTQQVAEKIEEVNVTPVEVQEPLNEKEIEVEVEIQKEKEKEFLENKQAIDKDKESEEQPTEGAEATLNINEELVVTIQSRIRQHLARVAFLDAKANVERRKAELEQLARDEKVLRGIIKFQACIRGRFARRMIQRQAAIYRRNEIAKEILTTERKYVQNLDVLVTKFLEPMQSNNIISPSHIKNIFSNIIMIRSYNEQLLSRLEERMSNWFSSGQKLGDIFLEMTEFLKVYTMYVNNYNTSIATMTQLLGENSKFAAFVEKMRVNPDCAGLDFASFLIQPIQRLPRYVLLLQDLVKHTPRNHPDAAQLGKALKKMKDVADYVNERKREAENLTQVLAIQSRLTGKFENLAEPHRRYVRKGTLGMLDEKGAIKSFFFFLFNDILIYTENKSASRIFRGSFGRASPNWDDAAFSGSKFKFMGSIPLAGIGGGLADVPDSEKEKVYCAFQLINQSTSHLFIAMNPEEKLAWMNDLDDCINQLLEKERSRKVMLSVLPEDQIHPHRVAADMSFADLESTADHSGYLFKKSNLDEWKQKWFALKNGVWYYFSEKPTAANAANLVAKAIHLVWCSIKVGHALDSVRPCVLQLATPSRIFFLGPPDIRTMFLWIYVLRLAIVSQLEGLKEHVDADSFASLASVISPEMDFPSPRETTISEMLRIPTNRMCADCGAPDPRWFSITLGIFLCLACSGIHRHLPPGVSVLKSIRSIGSLSLDSGVGNAQANAKYEKNVPPYMQKPTPGDPYDIKVSWIRAKYLPTADEKQIASLTPTRRSSAILVGQSSHSPSPSSSPPSTPPMYSSSPTPSMTSIENVLKRQIERKNSGGDGRLSKNKEGMLYKKQETLIQEEWKLYRFTMKEGRLLYFKPKRKKESGIIELFLCTVRTGENIVNSDRPKYTFELIAPTRIYTLAAESKEARDEWVQSINVCIVTSLNNP